jgi:hypothetical protein
MLFAIWGIIGISVLALFFLGISLKGMLFRKPVLISNRWFLVLFSILLFPLILFMGFHSHGVLSLNLLNWTMCALFLLMIWYLWKLYINGYSIYGITDKSFRKILLESLGQVKLKYTEDMTGIRIKSPNLALTTNLLMGVGHIRMKGKGIPELAEMLAPVLKKELSKKGVGYDIMPFLFYLATGLMFLLMAYFQWLFQHKLGRF